MKTMVKNVKSTPKPMSAKAKAVGKAKVQPAAFTSPKGIMNVAKKGGDCRFVS